MLNDLSFVIMHQVIWDSKHKEKRCIDENNVWVNHRVVAVIPQEKLKGMENDDNDAKYLKMKKEFPKTIYMKRKTTAQFYSPTKYEKISSTTKSVSSTLEKLRLMKDIRTKSYEPSSLWWQRLQLHFEKFAENKMKNSLKAKMQIMTENVSSKNMKMSFSGCLWVLSRKLLWFQKLVWSISEYNPRVA